MNFKWLSILPLLIIAYVSRANDEKNFVSSNLKTVTVYRSGAELTHLAQADLQRGNVELIIEGISNQLDINSVQVNCPASVTILGVEFSNNYLTTLEISPRIRFLRDSLDQSQEDLEKISVSIGTTNDLLEVLKANRDIKGNQTGLSVAELAKLMDYYKIKSTELQHELSGLKIKQKKINEQVARIRNQIKEEESKNTKTSGRLILQLSVAMAGKADFTISYITQNAHWTPYYDVRVDNISKPLNVIYKAKMVQTTGIDWKKVKLSLSTSVPSMWGSAPILKSWFLSYVNPVAVMERNLGMNRIHSYDELTGKTPRAEVNEVIVSGYSATKKGGSSNKPLYVVNGAIMSEEEFAKISQSAIKSIEVLKADQAAAIYGSRGTGGVIIATLKEGLDDYVSVTDNELNVTFDIDIPYDVPTNGKEQTATLKEYSVGSQYKYYTVPKLDKDAYLLAEVSDWENLNLLPGDANIIFEGTYVGKSFIDPNSSFDTLNLTLGRDKRVVVKREKLIDYSSVKFLGNYKHQKITYELTIKNNKKDTVRMLLKDQFPLSTNNDIEVELLESSQAMVNAELGILSWKLELTPGESKKIRFAYSVKYPKDKMLNLN
jgi:Domain of unknown function (DUF4139)/N-terminal domain of unknown function (DUF4140)/TonB-dependent Receptor Plug Domain